MRGSEMARGKRYQPEQVVNLLRQIEVAVANGKTTAQACKEAEIVEQTYFRWRKEYGGLQVDQAKRLKELEQENPSPSLWRRWRRRWRRNLAGGRRRRFWLRPTTITRDRRR
jgi:putative transposase